MMEADGSVWFNAWMMFLTFGPENLGYLAGDLNQTLSLHTMSIYFPLFEDPESSIPRKYIEVDADARNLHIISILNTSSLSDIHVNNFLLTWKSNSQNRSMNFEAKDDGLIHMIGRGVELTNQVYVHNTRQPYNLLYVTIELPVTADIIGQHSFEVFDDKNKSQFRSAKIDVRLKNQTVQLPRPEVVCNGDPDYCTILRMPGNVLLCQREEVIVRMMEKPILSKEELTSTWFIYTLFAIALSIIIILIYAGTTRLKKRMTKRTSAHMTAKFG
ncbi:unnamed protein product [Dicrocoelium dendriticum]|nr:unnamed protein product [Dicrocoelium dendriticum]